MSSLVIVGVLLVVIGFPAVGIWLAIVDRRIQRSQRRIK